MNDKLILGLDISTTTIGMCGLDMDKNLHFLSYVTLKKQPTLIEKADAFKMELLKYENMIGSVAIEEPLVMYKEGFSRAQILSKLSQFNGMCSMLAYIIYKVPPVHINVNTARKLAFPEMKFPKGEQRKVIVQETAAKVYQDVDWPLKPKAGTLKDECFDMADALIIARAMREILYNGGKV